MTCISGLACSSYVKSALAVGAEEILTMTTSPTVFKLQNGHEYMTEITIYNVHWATTQKIGKPELWSICSAHHLMVLYISVKFHDHNSNSFQVTEWT